MTAAATHPEAISLRTAANAAIFTAAVAHPALLRRWSRRAVQSTPPPLPLISLPPDDDWAEFEGPTRTGFEYTLPALELDDEDTRDESANANASSDHGTSNEVSWSLPRDGVDRAKMCAQLGDYMTLNENFQLRRHGFGIDMRLVYKRYKGGTRGGSNGTGALLDDVTAMQSPEEDLLFSALFESGNLDRAYRVVGRHYASTFELAGAAPSTSSTTTNTAGNVPFPFFVKVDMEYDLFCDVDLNSHGHIQWYFFRVQVPVTTFAFSSSAATDDAASTARHLKVRFNIRNMLKKASLYNDGMLPAVYIQGQRGWHHAGTNVCYFKNSETYRNRKSGKTQNYYTLSFVYEFRPSITTTQSSSCSAAAPMVVFFAHSYPYTYTRLQRYLLRLQKDPARSPWLRRRVLCKTIAGNLCDVLTITDFTQEDNSRTAIVLTARVHPGESPASFIMQGIIDFLTGSSVHARYLRHRFVFKVVPMLNPDGVIHGSYRCSLAGTDLNRRYLDPSPQVHPSIHATKNMMISVQKTRRISLYCDIHGHSRKRNIFLYGCRQYDDMSRVDAARVRLFPHVLCKTSPAARGGFFSFEDCTFSVSRSKRGTGRVVAWDELGILHSFTVEASFFGTGSNHKHLRRGASGARRRVTEAQSSMSGPNAYETMTTHFMPSDLRMAGTAFCMALIPFAHLHDIDRSIAPGPAEANRENITIETSDSNGSSHSQSQIHQDAAVTSPTPANTQTRHASPLDVVATPSINIVAQPLSGSRSPPRLSPKSSMSAFALSTQCMDAVDRPCHASTPPTRGSSASWAPSGSPYEPFLLGSAGGDSVDPPTAGECFDEMMGSTFAALFPSLSSPEDILKEIEESLPETLPSNTDDEDSPGSESDPSGDDMEDEELQHEDSWKHLVVHPAVEPDAPVQPILPRPKTQMLLKRSSESKLISVPSLSRSAQPLTQPIKSREATINALRNQAPLTRSTPTPLPAIVPSIRPTTTVSKLTRYPTCSNLTRGDRNREIAAMHLGAVKRRTKTRRNLQRATITEENETT